MPGSNHKLSQFSMEIIFPRYLWIFFTAFQKQPRSKPIFCGNNFSKLFGPFHCFSQLGGSQSKTKLIELCSPIYGTSPLAIFANKDYVKVWISLDMKLQLHKLSRTISKTQSITQIVWWHWCRRQRRQREDQRMGRSCSKGLDKFKYWMQVLDRCKYWINTNIVWNIG